MTIERRTSLRRGKPLRSGGSLRRTGRLNPFSRRRGDELEANARERRAVFARDGGCLLRGMPGAGRCLGHPTVHHIRKAGAGGAYRMFNLVWLCSGHNDWVETAQGQALAEEWGLWCRRGMDLEECWHRMRSVGLVTYHWNGEPR